MALLDLSSDQATAIGTLALAAVGAVTLWANRAQVKATRKAAEATERSAEATLREAKQISEQVEIARKQTQLSAAQNQAAQLQVLIAQRSLAAQSAPVLIPAGMEACRFGDVLTVLEAPTVKIRPVYLGVINAGNGAAIIDVDRSEAARLIEGARTPMTLTLPPALAAGTEARIKLTPGAGESIEPRAGITFEVTIAYRAFAEHATTMTIAFTARYYVDDHWVVKVREA